MTKSVKVGECDACGLFYMSTTDPIGLGCTVCDNGVIKAIVADKPQNFALRTDKGSDLTNVRAVHKDGSQMTAYEIAKGMFYNVGKERRLRTDANIGVVRYVYPYKKTNEKEVV